MKSHTGGGSKLVGKKGQFSTGIFTACYIEFLRLIYNNVLMKTDDGLKP